MANKITKFVDTVKNLAFGDYVDLVAPSIYRGGMNNGAFYFGGNGLDYRFSYNNHSSSLEAYQKCPPLTAVINRKAQCYINGKTEIINTQETESNSAAAKRLKALLKNPNPLQTWKQFEAQQYIYIQLFGFCVTLPIIPAGFEKLGPLHATSLWNIPPYMLDIAESNKLFYQTDITGIIDYIRLDYKGIQTQLPLENLFIFKDFTPSANSLIFPESRIKSLTMPINNIIGAYLSRNELINYAGAQGLMSPAADDINGAIPLKGKEKAELQEDFKRQYGIQRGQWRYIIAPTAMNWVPIGKPTKDLMLFEEISDDIMRICDTLNYPSPLLNSEKGPSVSNTAVYQAQIYTDGIIPESEDIYEQWDRYFKLEKLNLCIRKNYNHVSVLQENKKEQGQALLYLNQSNMLLWNQDLITANEIRESNEMDLIPEWGNMYRSEFIAQGKLMPALTTNPLEQQTDNNDSSKDDDKD